MSSHISILAISQALTNLQQSIENWSQNFLTSDVLSFGGYLMMFFLVMVLALILSKTIKHTYHEKQIIGNSGGLDGAAFILRDDS